MNTQQYQDPGKRSVSRPIRAWKEPTNQERLETIQREIAKIMDARTPVNGTVHELLLHLRTRERALIWEIEKEKTA